MAMVWPECQQLKGCGAEEFYRGIAVTGPFFKIAPTYYTSKCDKCYRL